MSDTSWPQVLHYGTNAQRLAFTPSPPTSGQPLYIWYETDTGNSYAFDTTWHQITSIGVLPSSVQGDIFYSSTTNSVVTLVKSTTATRYLSNQGTTNNPSWSAVNLANGVTGTLSKVNQGAGTIIQIVNTITGAVNTGTTQIPLDDTPPLITEGDEYMTLAITPTNIANKLKIDVVWIGSASGGGHIIVALFQDTTSTTLASAVEYDDTATGMRVIPFSWYMTAGTTSSTVFKVRAGIAQSGTTTFNGFSGARKLGGSIASSITITESQV